MTEQPVNEVNKQRSPLCVSVFRGGRATPIRADYTKLWAELINRAEKGKQAK